MDRVEYTSLVQAFEDVPDPRAARGKRYPWSLLLTLVSAALASGQTHGRGISQWVHEHAGDLQEALEWSLPRWPSEATLRRTVRDGDEAVLEQRVSALTFPAPASTTPLHGQAIDGKVVRGAMTHGQPVHLVALVHHSGMVLAQTVVPAKTNEITAAPLLLGGRDLTGTVTTMDALLTQYALAEQIRRQGGDYLMVVKDNQPELLEAITTLFVDPPWLTQERVHEYAQTRTIEKGHGRLETRTVEASPSLTAWLDWPDVGQVLRRTCRRVHQRTGDVQKQVTYGITSIPFNPHAVHHIETYWRGHWSIENRVHHIRDVTLGEDRGQAHTGATAHTRAILRNMILNLLRARGTTHIADALRHIAASPRRALALIGVEGAGL